MITGETVRLKTASPLARRLNLPREAVGAVMCRYSLLRGGRSAQKLDVQFGPGLVVWGAPAEAFEPAVGEKASA
ncbi:hypothetical protein GGD83_003494 [Rhodoblastus sphagnicola]|uniref:hypothetical protein n=1 Tax=Rhodoblastus sphagnicola TaxID=333368 RepID=UPI0011B013B5|nr:hypothetical protein [Rhodoblastus sphagnicola]MBB4199673.1 hypothetical protein [Rhodoblastus sphagnicola]